MKPQPAGLWAVGELFRAAQWAGLARGGRALRAFALDAVIALGVVTAGLLVWSPRLGVQAARETIAARRARRRHLAEIGRLHGAVWARHAQRRIGPRLPYVASMSARPPTEG